MESLPPFTESKFLSCRNKERKLGSNNMIPVGRHEILSRLDLSITSCDNRPGLHPAITCEKCHPRKAGSVFLCCHDPVLPGCNCFNSP